MNEFESSFLNSFTQSVLVSKLMSDNNSIKEIPNVKGIYIVASEVPVKRAFVEKGTGGFFKGKNPNVSIGKLEDSWVESSCIFYIGKAGGYKTDGELKNSTLQSRIRELIKFGSGTNIGHWGGRYLWQLAFSKELLIYFRACPGTEDPDTVETNLIQEYKSHYGKSPFANLNK